jgi:hypothetical protein
MRTLKGTTCQATTRSWQACPIPALPEIWAFGLRNPWKFSFDDPALGGTGAMLIGDVGQNAYEEVDYQPPAAGGRNYGWRVFEGAHPYIGSPGPAYLPLVGPIAEYDHTVGHSITGGFVYRGCSLGATYRGRYFYADFVNARVWSFALISDGAGGVTVSAPIEHTAELGGSGAIGNVSAFGLDSAGELYIVSYSSGQILKVAPPPMFTTASCVSPLTRRSDFNRDGTSDMVWQNHATGQVSVWYLGGQQGRERVGFDWLSASGVLGWTVKVAADLNGDSTPDLIWQNETTREVVAWYMGGAGGTTYQGLGWLTSGPVPGWTVVAASDVDGDLRPDLIWQNDSTYQVVVWFMGGSQGTVLQRYTWLASNGPVGWLVVGVADVNRDGAPDLIWQQESTRQVSVWYLGGPDGTTFMSWNWMSQSLLYGWAVVGSTDVNGDGYPDVLWQNDTTGEASVWFMSGAQGNVRSGWASLTNGPLPGWSAVLR